MKLKFILSHCRTSAPSLASSVTSLSSPRSLELTDSAVDHMVKTIEQQEEAIQSTRKQVMMKLREVQKFLKEEEKLRYVHHYLLGEHLMQALSVKFCK